MVVLGSASDGRVEREFEGLAELVTTISRLELFFLLACCGGIGTEGSFLHHEM